MRKWIEWFVMVLLVMIGGPLVAITVDEKAAMAVCLFLFFVLDPMCVLYTGIFAGGNLRRRWFLPFLSIGIFAIGAWRLLAMDTAGLCLYGTVYLVVGVVAMLICAAILHSKIDKDV